LSSAIVFGLSFATLLTLVVTPAMLMVFTREAHRKGRQGLLGRLFRRGRQIEAPEVESQGQAGRPALAYPKAAE
jgi:multidrug efflux pump